METYKSGIQNANYNFRGNSFGSTCYNLKEYRQEYTGNTSSENLYNNLMKFVPRGSHIGNYKSEK